MQDVAKDVIDRAAEGDSDAFGEILKCYGDMVFNVSLRVLRNREDAEEVTQDVFLLLHRKLKGFEGRSSLKTWIYRITMNAALYRARGRDRMRKRTVTYDEQHSSNDQIVMPDDSVGKEYAQHTVTRLLGLLSVDQRACVVLRSIEGLSYEEIAKTLGIALSAVRSRLKRAREKMMASKSEVMDHEM